MSYAGLISLVIMISACSTAGKARSDLAGRLKKTKASQKRIAYLNPPPDSKYKADFTKGPDGFVMNKLVESRYYPNPDVKSYPDPVSSKLRNKPIPERDWNIMTYDCNHFANDAVKHLRQDFYVWVLSYTYSHRPEFENLDMRNLSADELEEIERQIPEPRLTRFQGSILSSEAWREKYNTLNKMVQDSGMHSGVVMKVRKWVQADNGGYLRTQDVYAFIEPQSGYYVVDWPVSEGVRPKDKQVVRTLLHHMWAQEGYFDIAGPEGVAVFDPSDLVKESYFCAAKTKVAFDWKNPSAWVRFWGNNISRLEHCKGCCADKTVWAKEYHDTDGIDHNVDTAYQNWYDSCRNICQIMFKK